MLCNPKRVNSFICAANIYCSFPTARLLCQPEFMHVTGFQPLGKLMQTRICWVSTRCQASSSFYLICTTALGTIPMPQLGKCPQERPQDFPKVIQVEKRAFYVPGAVLSSLHLLPYFTNTVTMHFNISEIWKHLAHNLICHCSCQGFVLLSSSDVLK